MSANLIVVDGRFYLVDADLKCSITPLMEFKCNNYSYSAKEVKRVKTQLELDFIMEL